MKQNRIRLSVAPLPKEIRWIIGFYLIFLVSLISYANQPHRSIVTSGIESQWERYLHKETGCYNLQPFGVLVDSMVSQELRKAGFLLVEGSWSLKQREEPVGIRWVETEFRAELETEEPTKQMEELKGLFRAKMQGFGLDCRYADGIQLGETLHYRLEYGSIFAGKEIITHRVFLILRTIKDEDNKHGLKLRALNDGKKRKNLAELTPKFNRESKRRLDDTNVSETRPKMSERPGLKPDIRQGMRSESPHIAIIIDDVGFVKEPTEAYFAIREPLTFAVLPGGKYSREHAIRAVQEGFEIILHQPMEPMDSGNDPGPGLITSLQSDEEILEIFRANLADVPGAKGFNNHMGSKGTKDSRVMRTLLMECKLRNLFFIDSRSINDSVGESIARQVRLPYAGRDIFIDNSLRVEMIHAQLEKLHQIAITRGKAIGIAHARPGVAQAIAEYIPKLTRSGVKIVHVSELLNGL